MLDKYFGFLRIYDEYSVLDSFIEHIRIDDQELLLLNKMIGLLIAKNTVEIDSMFQKILKINEESKRIFENEAEQIILANFDNQKQYDYLRTFQRIEHISNLIITTAQKIVILDKIKGFIPECCSEPIQTIFNNIIRMYEDFQSSLVQYQNNKKNILSIIKKIEETNKSNKNEWADCLLAIFQAANDDKLALGTSQCLESLVKELHNISDAIQEAASSLEWLLIR